ncbi:MAG: hypothetical protein GEV03_25595 [Streptosporangiales bacterium]|nr:hypothetical protein [Streptosporangiales bacterium]
MLPYVAYLRVYEPLVAFPEPARSAWTVYAVSGDRPSRSAALSVEHRQSLWYLVALPPIVAPERESRHAYIRRFDGTTYICPWHTRLRSWLALAEFRSSMPARVVDSFVPPAVARQVEADFERWKRGNPQVRPHILTSTWQIPLPWFVPFRSSERWLVLGDGAGGGRDTGGPTTAAATRTLGYVTSMAQARRRVARALAVVRRRLGDSAVLVGVEDVGRWLEEFHPRSLVELDYGGLVHLLDDAALRADQSVAEVGAVLSGLDAGQSELAVAMYKRLVTRWRVVQDLETAN